MKDSWIIFDLDGTLADIENRRKLAVKANGKMDWDIFFSTKLVETDEPKQSVIEMANVLKDAGHKIAILSGRSKATKQVTTEWLRFHGVPWDVIKLRPTSHPWKFMPDDKLKKGWLDDLWPDDKKDSIVCVFDDRDKVVQMWRENGLDCFQVAPGNF
tara:strand:+ start:1560 stop:2030 length:471 start_codon:yes stop_codon:yes gene_type:complete